MKQKRVWLIVCVTVILLSLLSAGTYMYFTTESTARNVVTTGGISFEILETTNTGDVFPAQGVTVKPGDVVSKIVTLKNVSDETIWVRVALEKRVAEDKELPADEQLQPNINTEDWTEQDGFYYYNAPLAAGEETAPLFTEVTVDGKSVDNRYRGMSFELDVLGSAVQAANNGDTVFSALGWPEAKGN